MTLSYALSIVATLVITLLGFSVITLAIINLAAMIRSGRLSPAWSVIVASYEIGLSVLVGGIEVDLYSGPGLLRGLIYGLSFSVLLFGLSVQSRVVGMQAGKHLRDAELLREQLRLLKAERDSRP